MHPTSLPSRGGIGDLGPAAYRFVDFLAEARQKIWQMLPLGPVDSHHSPYSASSAFAGNPLLISLERLAEQHWIEARRLDHLPPASDDVAFNDAAAAKIPLLREAAGNFLQYAPESLRHSFEEFRKAQGWWLEDFVLFEALHQQFNQPWTQWPHGLARRDENALKEARSELEPDLAIRRVIQFAFFEQWKSLRAYCAEKTVSIIGDVAIFVNHDSADVWTYPELFHLKDDLSPDLVSGVPPDLFSDKGQRWGNPLYRWDVIKSTGYAWWIQRMRGTLQLCDFIRLDHFIGFTRYWEIPAESPDATRGRWVPGPGEDLFTALHDALGDLPFIAEDLGVLTPEVIALREKLGLPGMRILQFGFGSKENHGNLPYRHEKNCVVYTGTHDNDTTLGWWNAASPADRHEALALFGKPPDGFPWALIRAAAGSVADLCVFPLQDVMGLDGSARMNFPSHPDGNWGWRFSWEMLSHELVKRLADLTYFTERV